MNEKNKEAKAITKTRISHGFNSFGKTSEEEKPASRYTFFLLCLVAIIAGGWAITCLARALSADGPGSLFRQLTSALLGK